MNKIGINKHIPGHNWKSIYICSEMSALLLESDKK